MTGICFDTVTNDWAIEIEAAGGVVGYATTASEAASMLQDEVARWERFHSAQAASLAAMMPARMEAPAIAPQVATAPVSCAPVALPAEAISRPRCSFHKSIRRCFGLAKERGLNTRDDEAMRGAFARYLCCDVPSREVLTALDWNILGDAIKARRLAW